MSERFRKIGAWAGIVLLVGMYLLTLVSAIFSSESSSGLFIASLYCTFVVPVWIFLLQLFYKRSHPEGSIGKNGKTKTVCQDVEPEESSKK